MTTSMGCQKSTLLATVVALAVLTTVNAGGAQVVGPVGTEFQVNTYTTSYQAVPAICTAADGSFVVVWDGASTNESEIFAQRYSSNGFPAGTEFQVNTYTPGDEQNPAICCDAGGSFVVVWAQFNNQDGDKPGVFGQRFASDGAFVGSEFQINTYTTDDQERPAVCCDATGNFVVAWQSYRQDGNRNGVFGQRFASNGAPRGTEFQVNSYTPGDQQDPAICCSADGDFVIAWSSYGEDGDKPGVFAQRFASNGAFRGNEFQVNTYTPSYQTNPAICCSADGNFVVAWQSFGQVGYAYQVFGQRFTSAGAPRGSEFQVPTANDRNDADPALCCSADGDFVVTWTRFRDFTDDIFVRRFADSGLPFDGEQRVNFFTPSYQELSAVACGEDGKFVVVWQSEGQDGSDFGVFGLRFALFPVAASPALSWLGLGAVIVGLLGAGVRQLRRRH